MSKVIRELKKLEAMCDYANKLVRQAGIADQVEKSKLYGINNRDYFKTLLTVREVFPEFDGNRAVVFDVHGVLHKRFYEYGDKIHYITLVDLNYESVTSQSFDWYESKTDIDECEAIIELKQRVRSMIENPNKYFISA